MSRKIVFKPIDGLTLGSAGSYTNIWTPDTGNKFVLHGYSLQSTNGTEFKLKDGTTVFMIIPSTDGGSSGPGSQNADLSIPYPSATIDNILSITSTSNSDTVNGYVYGEED